MEKLSALIEEVPARIPTRPLPVRRQVQAIDPLPNRSSLSQVGRLPEGPEGSHIGQVKRWQAKLRLVSIEKDIEGFMPQCHFKKIKTILESMEEGDIFSIGERIYVSVRKWNEETLKIPALPLLLPPGFRREPRNWREARYFFHLDTQPSRRRLSDRRRTTLVTCRQRRQASRAHLFRRHSLSSAESSS